MPPATRRTLAKEKSSAMTARQPSVPNLIGAVVGRWSLVVGLSGLLIGGQPVKARSNGVGQRLRLACPEQAKRAEGTNDRRRFSYQLLQSLRIQMLHHFSHVLRIRSRGHQQRVAGVDDHNVVDADHGDKFSWSMNVVPARVQGKDALRRNQVAILRRAT